jgi:hypothetical protein
MPDPARPVPQSGHKDRKGALVLCGAVLILVGAGCALLVPFGLLGAALNQPGHSWRNSFGIAAICLALAVSFVWLGIGSILTRRWARTLTLMLAWTWLITGLVHAAVTVFLLPAMMKWMMLGGDFGADVEQVYPIILGIVVAVMGTFLVALPGALILFYGNKHVRATVEARDPHLSWTERRPQPVVLLSVSHAVLAYFLVVTGFMYRFTVPLFGVLASGWAGALLVLASTGISVYLAATLYERRPSAWWIATGLAAVWTVSAVMTFLRVPIAAYYMAAGMPPETLDLLAGLGDLTWVTVSSIVAISGAYFVYLVFARRFYRGALDGS